TDTQNPPLGWAEAPWKFPTMAAEAFLTTGLVCFCSLFNHAFRDNPLLRLGRYQIVRGIYTAYAKYSTQIRCLGADLRYRNPHGKNKPSMDIEISNSPPPP